MPNDKITKYNGLTGEIISEEVVIISQDEKTALDLYSEIDTLFRLLRTSFNQTENDIASFDSLTSNQKIALLKRILQNQKIMFRLLRALCLKEGFRQGDNK